MSRLNAFPPLTCGNGWIPSYALPKAAGNRHYGDMTDTNDRPNRLNQILAWVGIIAGVVFIVAVIFFSGFWIGSASGHHCGWHHGYHNWGQMGPGGPMGPGQMGPGGMMGPGQIGPGGMMPGGATTPPAATRP
jgi:hypothetical protein